MAAAGAEAAGRWSTGLPLHSVASLRLRSAMYTSSSTHHTDERCTLFRFHAVLHVLQAFLWRFSRRLLRGFFRISCASFVYTKSWWLWQLQTSAAVPLTQLRNLLGTLSNPPICPCVLWRIYSGLFFGTLCFLYEVYIRATIFRVCFLRCLFSGAGDTLPDWSNDAIDDVFFTSTQPKQIGGGVRYNPGFEIMTFY